jgi:hypothetical protein
MPSLFGSRSLSTNRLSFKMPGTEHVYFPPCSKTPGDDIGGGCDQLYPLVTRYRDDSVDPLFTAAKGIEINAGVEC